MTSTEGGRALVHVGDEIDKIPVSISYRIIELFSAGLYSSPNKALEELVSNSYDAYATDVQLFMPSNLTDPAATIWVVDNGESMDLPGLFDLWTIAQSTKRERRPNAIGKFGIGKLATYVLARQLTYVCRREGRILAVTMDYGQINPDSNAATPIELPVRELEESETELALAPLKAFDGGEELVSSMLDGTYGDKSWTTVAMGDLRPAASQLQQGRIRWLLSTALPMGPQFNCSLNGKPVTPTVDEIEPLAAWAIGERDGEYPDRVTPGADDEGTFVEIEGLAGRVRGEVKVYRDVLTKGKRADHGRSHGIFVVVRGRLINLDDALFGMPALSHATFNRFYMRVDADGLDQFLASTRESVTEADAVNLLREYMRDEFNAARSHFETWIAKEEQDVASRVDKTPSSTSRRPLVAAVKALVSGDVDRLSLIEVPVGLSDEGKHSLVEGLETALNAGEGLVDEVVLEPRGVDHFIATYEPRGRRVVVNTLHPFFANFIERMGRSEPFELIAVAEILSEAYLLEEGINPRLIARIIERRDQFLRELVAAGREGPAVIAQNLRDQSASSGGLEDAAADAFRSLGFQVAPKGGAGKPDGVAMALVGVRDPDEDQREDYSITYDTKSTGGSAVKAHTVGVSTLARHRKDYKSQYSVVIAPAFEGGNTRESALGKECVEHNVTPIKIDDFALLVLVATTRQLGYTKLREWLDSCRTAEESHDWVVKELDAQAEEPPVVPLLHAIADLQQDQDDPVRIAGVEVQLRSKYGVQLRHNRIIELISSVASFAPGYITFDGDSVNLEMSVERVIEVIAKHQRQVPEEVLRESYILPLIGENPPRSGRPGSASS